MIYSLEYTLLHNDIQFEKLRLFRAWVGSRDLAWWPKLHGGKTWFSHKVFTHTNCPTRGKKPPGQSGCSCRWICGIFYSLNGFCFVFTSSVTFDLKFSFVRKSQGKFSLCIKSWEIVTMLDLLALDLLSRKKTILPLLSLWWALDNIVENRFVGRWLDTTLNKKPETRRKINCSKFKTPSLWVIVFLFMFILKSLKIILICL